MIEPARHTERNCPGCGARLEIDHDLLGDADQLATCTLCGTCFHPDSGSIVDAECADPFARATALRLSPTRTPLPFEVPQDLPPLEPHSGLVGQGGRERSRVGPVAAFSGVLLAAVLLAQIAWHLRVELVQALPRLATLCAAWDCPGMAVAAPERYRVIARDLHAARSPAGALTLDLQLRNEAAFAQPYPIVQLALLDSRGTVVQRGYLHPADYLEKAPGPGMTVAAGATFTLSVNIADPGPSATGFAVDFF